MSTLSEIGDYLEVEGVANLFLGSMPDTPDDVVVVYQYPGGPPEYIQESFTPSREKPRIQVVARATRYEDADKAATEVWSILASITNQVLGSTKYLSIRPDDSPAIMGRDTNDRLKVYFNAAVDKEVSLVS